MGISARIVKRIITLLIVTLGVVTLSFCLQIFTGTDPAEMLVRKTTLFATEEQIQAMRVELGLDGTLSEQYADYIKGLLTGDLGISITNRKPVIDNIRDALPVTCMLVIMSMLWVAILTVLISAFSVIWKDKAFDHATRVICIIGICVPSFWLALILLIAFAVEIPIFSVISDGSIIKELKAYSKTDVYLDELDKKLENVIRCSFRNELAPGASTTAAQFILRFGLVAVLLIGGNLVIEGMLSIPMLILFLLFAGRIYDPFTNCFMLLAEVFAALVSIGRMKQIDNTQEQTGSDCCNNIGCDIEFKDVYFSYNEEPVLTGVSFVAKQGEITALVGPSGSGKSTVSKLAARFWDADSGLITLGGIDVKTVEPEVLLKNYAIVFQNVTLFDESVMENIRLGRSGASDEDVRAAAKAAQCDEFIDRLPQGYDTNIGENGSKLSGGERQRISIARALLKNAPVILLDEATASMDAESETMVQTALSALLKGRTVIVIAHRMRTIANADKIVVLDKGKVTEVGTPSELAKKGGLYAHLVALQQKQQMSSLPT